MNSFLQQGTLNVHVSNAVKGTLHISRCNKCSSTPFSSLSKNLSQSNGDTCSRISQVHIPKYLFHLAFFHALQQSAKHECRTFEVQATD